MRFLVFTLEYHIKKDPAFVFSNATKQEKPGTKGTSSKAIVQYCSVTEDGGMDLRVTKGW